MASMFLPSPISSPSHYTSPTSQSQSSYFFNLPSPSPLPQNTATSRRRPTLSLNTSNCPRSFNNKGQASLRLDTTAASPTQHNTHRNSFAVPSPSPLKTHTRDQSPSPQNKLSLLVPVLRPSGPQRPQSDSVISHDRTPSSPLRVSTITATVPYARDPNLRSILVNGPLPIRSALANISVEKVVKTVSFSEAPIEIETRQHTLRHSDIPSRSPSPASPVAEDNKLPMLSLAIHTTQKHQLSSPTDDSSEYTLSSCHHIAEDGDETDPKTPIAGRKKRQRDWKWTLGPLGSDEAEALSQDE